MKCDVKTMVQIGGVVALFTVLGFLAFPQFRPVLIGLAPFLLLALCPLSMFFAMRGTKKDGLRDSSV